MNNYHTLSDEQKRLVLRNAEENVHLPAAADEIRFGIYACSPEESSFTAVFSNMKITECAWRAHDGQQPDEEK